MWCEKVRWHSRVWANNTRVFGSLEVSEGPWSYRKEENMETDPQKDKDETCKMGAAKIPQRFRKDSAKIDSLVNIGVPRRILKEWPESFRNWIKQQKPLLPLLLDCLGVHPFIIPPFTAQSTIRD